MLEECTVFKPVSVILYHEWFTIELQLIVRQHTNGNHFERDVRRDENHSLERTVQYHTFES